MAASSSIHSSAKLVAADHDRAALAGFQTLTTAIVFLAAADRGGVFGGLTPTDDERTGPNPRVGSLV
jgi:hypothetical protein